MARYWPQIPLYSVGQKVRWSFSIRCYGKTTLYGKKYNILMKDPNPVESPNTMNPLKPPGNDPSNECEYSCIFILMGGSSQLYYSTKLPGSGRFSTGK